MPNALINGVNIYYEDTGSNLPAVVLSHGFLMDHEMFAPQVEALKLTHRVITWDERGFGGTLATDEFTYWDSAKDVLGLMDFLGIDSAIVGGMSQGGFLSLRVALTAPERVRPLTVKRMAIKICKGLITANRIGYTNSSWRSNYLNRVSQLI